MPQQAAHKNEYHQVRSVHFAVRVTSRFRLYNHDLESSLVVGSHSRETMWKSVVAGSLRSCTPKLEHRVRHGLAIAVQHSAINLNPNCVRICAKHLLAIVRRKANRKKWTDSLRSGWIVAHFIFSIGVKFRPRKTMSNRNPRANSGEVCSQSNSEISRRFACSSGMQL